MTCKRAKLEELKQKGDSEKVKGFQAFVDKMEADREEYIQQAMERCAKRHHKKHADGPKKRDEEGQGLRARDGKGEGAEKAKQPRGPKGKHHEGKRQGRRGGEGEPRHGAR